MRRSNGIRLALVCGATLAWVLLGISIAGAASFSGASPTSVASTQSVSNVSISVDVADSVTFYSSTFMLDGVTKPAYLERPVGYWDGDGCDMWWVSDDTKGRIRYSASSLSVGQHTATATVRNSAGASSSYSWTFEVKPSSVSFAGFAPPDGTQTVVWNPEIGVWADGLVELSDAPVITVDGVAHEVRMLWGDQRIDAETWNDIIYNALPWEVPTVDFTKGWISWTPASLADGRHTVSVVARDGSGRSKSTSWIFDVAAPPKITAAAPANGALVTSQKPEISAIVKDNGVLSQPKLYVDGVPVSAAFDPATGSLSWKPSEPLANDRPHTARVEAVDQGGLSTQAEWGFTVQIYADMPVSSTCEDCHEPAQHPMSNCNACHAVVPQIGHGLTPAPASRCTQCHHVYSHGAAQITPGVTWGGADEPQEGYTGYWGRYCDWCHTPSRFPSIPAHAVDNAALHNSSADLSSCSPCHVTSLTREHNRYTDSAGSSYDCDTCHGADAAEEVRAAVAAGDTRCATCHDAGSGGTHPHPAAAIEGVLANAEKECIACHSADLVTEHAKQTSTGSNDVCDTCHAQGGPRDRIVGAWDRKCDTPACHAAGTERAVHENWCLACHGPGQPDFATVKCDFSAPQSAVSTKCASCHGSGIQTASIYPWSSRRNESAKHLSHQAYDPCVGCHYLPDNSQQEWRYSQFALRPEGSFASSISPTLGEGLVHEQHTAGSLWAGSEFSVVPGYTVVCGNCHTAAGCAACHDVDAVPASHANHVASPNRRVAVGSATFIGADTRQTESVACAAAGCHSPAGLSTSGKVVQDSTGFSYEGTWTAVATQRRAQYGSYRVSSGSAGEKVTFTVQGPGRAVVFGAGNVDGGIATVLVDGQVAGTADCYQAMTNGSTEEGPRYGVELFQTPELGPGQHTIQLVATGTKASLSVGARIYVDAVWTYPTRDLKPRCSGCHADRVANHW